LLVIPIQRQSAQAFAVSGRPASGFSSAGRKVEQALSPINIQGAIQRRSRRVMILLLVYGLTLGWRPIDLSPPARDF
jgi:hypothetical protein